MAGRSDDSDLDKLEAGRASEIRARRAATGGGRMVGLGKASLEYEYVRSDFPHLFQFRFSKEGVNHIVTKSTWIPSGWPGQGLAKHIWSGLEESRCTGIIRPGFWQDATGLLPVSHFQTRFRSSTDVPDNTVQNQPGSDLVLADCVRFWPNGSGPEASQCARIIRPGSGQCLPADPDRMRIGSGMFTRK